MTNTTTVTVRFTDVVGTTAMRRGLSDAAAERALLCAIAMQEPSPATSPTTPTRP